MNKKKKESEVEVRLRAAFLAHAAENPAIPISISELCRKAGVNRSNVYANYPGLVKEFGRKNDRSAKAHTKLKSLGERLEDALRERNSIEKRYNSLLLVCIELEAEVRHLRNAIDVHKRPTRSK